MIRPPGDSTTQSITYRLAEQIRELIGDADDRFLLCLLQDINHVVQELQHRGRDPARTFETCLAAGRRLRETQGDGFFAAVQHVRVSDSVTLWCFHSRRAATPTCSTPVTTW